MKTLNLAALALTLFASGCASISERERTAVMAEVSETCGLISPRSRLKTGGDFRLRAYRACKSDVVHSMLNMSVDVRRDARGGGT